MVVVVERQGTSKDERDGDRKSTSVTPLFLVIVPRPNP